MIYQGSKSRIAKEILTIILKDRKPDQIYIEPFVGGGNTIQHVTGERFGYDNNQYLIALFKKLQEGWQPPTDISRTAYQEIKDNKEDYEDHIVAYAGFCASYRSFFFGGYATPDKNKGNRQRQCLNNLTKQLPLIQDVTFATADYLTLDFQDALIYADPPYADTTQQYAIKRKKFDSVKFWGWIRKQSAKNTVFISEKVAPDDFECVWEKEIINNASPNLKKQTIKEKLFKIKTK